MSISPNLKASLMKLATTQWTTTWCSNSFKASPRVSGKKSSKTQPSKCTTRWRRKQLVSPPPNALSTLCTNSPSETPLLDPTSKQTGNHKGNASRVPKANNLSDKDLARLPSTLPWHQGHGIINQFQWILIKLECQEGTGEGKDEVCKGGM